MPGIIRITSVGIAPTSLVVYIEDIAIIIYSTHLYSLTPPLIISKYSGSNDIYRKDLHIVIMSRYMTTPMTIYIIITSRGRRNGFPNISEYIYETPPGIFVAMWYDEREAMSDDITTAKPIDRS